MRASTEFVEALNKNLCICAYFRFVDNNPHSDCLYYSIEIPNV